MAAAGGAAAGTTVQAAIAGLGAAVLLARWPAAAVGLRICGGAYLLWLGAASLRRALLDAAPPDIRNTGTPATGRSFRQGLTVNLLNPAITSFYVGVLPAFMPADAGRGYYAFLASAHIAIAFGCHTGWTLAFGLLRRHVEKPSVRRMLDGIAGLVLIALAVQVLIAAGSAGGR